MASCSPRCTLQRVDLKCIPIEGANLGRASALLSEQGGLRRVPFSTQHLVGHVPSGSLATSTLPHKATPTSRQPNQAEYCLTISFGADATSSRNTPDRSARALRQTLRHCNQGHTRPPADLKSPNWHHEPPLTSTKSNYLRAHVSANDSAFSSSTVSTCTDCGKAVRANSAASPLRSTQTATQRQPNARRTCTRPSEATPEVD